MIVASRMSINNETFMVVFRLVTLLLVYDLLVYFVEPLTSPIPLLHWLAQNSWENSRSNTINKAIRKTRLRQTMSKNTESKVILKMGNRADVGIISSAKWG